MGDEPASAGELHAVADVDVSWLTFDQRAALELSLRSDGIRHEFTGDVLRFPAVWRRRVDIHLDEARSRAFEPGYTHQPYRPYAAVRREMPGCPTPGRGAGSSLR